MPAPRSRSLGRPGCRSRPPETTLRATASCPRPSERNFIVEIAALAGRCSAGGRRGALRAVGAGVRRRRALGAIEQLQLRVKTGQHDLGRIALDVVLIGPLARAQRALDVSLRSLFEVLLGDLAE